MERRCGARICAHQLRRDERVCQDQCGPPSPCLTPRASRTDVDRRARNRRCPPLPRTPPPAPGRRRASSELARVVGAAALYDVATLCTVVQHAALHVVSGRAASRCSTHSTAPPVSAPRCVARGLLRCNTSRCVAIRRVVSQYVALCRNTSRCVAIRRVVSQSVALCCNTSRCLAAFSTLDLSRRVPVLASRQTAHRLSPGPGADVAGWSPVPAQMWEG